MRLGDIFPQEDKYASFERQWHSRRIFRIDCVPPLVVRAKLKYLLLVVPDPQQPIFFFINSEINERVELDPRRRDGHVRIEQADCPCLTKDHSFVDCTKTIEVLTKSRIRYQALADLRRIGDEITMATTQQIVAKIQGARTFSRYQKRLMSDSLLGVPSK